MCRRRRAEERADGASADPRRIRRSRHATAKADQRGRIPDAVRSAKRPASAEDRAGLGHCRVICSADRRTVHCHIGRTPLALRDGEPRSRTGKRKPSSRHYRQQEAARRTLQIPDLGSRQGAFRPQTVQHGNRSTSTSVTLQSPGARSSENTNRLLRQYFPKGLILRGHSQAELNKVARKRNQRPRKTLDFKRQQSEFNQCVGAIC